MTPPTADHVSPPASPAQLASALLTSLQHVTSSARLFLSGCFQCEFLKAGCWRRQEEQDGAWFDCDKLQVEHPYCYVNPLAVAEVNTGTVPLSQSAALPPEPCPGSAFKASPQRSPGSALAPRGLGAPPAVILPKRSKKPGNDGGLVTENERQRERDDGGEENSPLRERVSFKDGAAKYVRGQGARIPLVKSFAAKLEADLRRIEYDRQRAEGEVVEAAPTEDDDDRLQEKRSTDGCVDAVRLPNTSSTFFCEESEDSPCLQKDVWKPSELEDVFECYNMAAFYSYGATFPAAEKFASKVRGEKFEEVFPVSQNNNNNNNIKVYKPASDSESLPSLTITDKDEAFIENVCATHENRENLAVSEDKLKQFIHACVFAESVSEVNEKWFLSNSNNKEKSKDIIIFGRKSFNKLLIFNLVKSVMSECAAQYPRSLPLCATYQVHLVQRKVLKVILEEDKIEENLCGLEMFHSPALLMQQEKNLARRLVEGVAASEIKEEDRQWQDFNNEEREMKETIFSELLHDLISDTTDVFKGLVAKKLAMSQEPEGD